MMRLLDQLTEQRDAKVSGQLYEWTQITMAYNSNRIEGSTLTLMQAQVLYTENKVSGSSDLDDFIEMRNHFRLFDYMLDTADASLSHELIKEYHRLLNRQKVSYIRGLNDYSDHPAKLIRSMEKYQKQYKKEIDSLLPVSVHFRL